MKYEPLVESTAKRAGINVFLLHFACRNREFVIIYGSSEEESCRKLQEMCERLVRRRTRYGAGIPEQTCRGLWRRGRRGEKAFLLLCSAMEDDCEGEMVFYRRESSMGLYWNGGEVQPGQGEDRRCLRRQLVERGTLEVCFHAKQEENVSVVWVDCGVADSHADCLRKLKTPHSRMRRGHEGEKAGRLYFTDKISPDSMQMGGAEGYQVLTKLGRGAESEVYLIKDPRGDIRVCKVSSNETMLRWEEKMLQMLQQEVLLIKQEGKCCLMKPYVPGHTLGEYLMKRKSLTLRQVLKLAIGLCMVERSLIEGENPIVFRDLKPENLIVGQDGILRPVDYGAACPEGAPVPFLAGTYEYAPPEQFIEGSKADRCMDFYAMGRILEQCLHKCRYKPREQGAWQILLQMIQRWKTQMPGERCEELSTTQNCLEGMCRELDRKKQGRGPELLENIVK